MKTTVIHHSADYDGIFCREIARKFLPEAELIGWDFGDKPLVSHPDTQCYILDLPCDKPFGFMHPPDDVFWKRCIWIDHHKSSIESHPANITGYRIDGVAACRLAWQWFSEFQCEPPRVVACDKFPTKQDFIDRKVREPYAVRLAGEYDIWDKRDPNTDVFQFGLRSKELTDKDWKWLLTVRDNMTQGEYELAKTNLAVGELLHDGLILQRYQNETDASIVNHRSFVVEFEGLKFLALTTARCNSLTFGARDIPETGHDALMGFYFNGTGWTVSLYHANHRKDLDLSQIAIKYGGGGHRGACGFCTNKLPFIN